MSERPTPEQLSAWRRLADNATPGEWKWWHPGGYSHCQIGAAGRLVANVFSSSARGPQAPDADAEFIAASRTALPALLDAYEALEVEYGRLLADVRRMRELTIPATEQRTEPTSKAEWQRILDADTLAKVPGYVQEMIRLRRELEEQGKRYNDLVLFARGLDEGKMREYEARGV